MPDMTRKRSDGMVRDGWRSMIWSCSSAAKRRARSQCIDMELRMQAGHKENSFIDELEEGQTVLDFYYDNERVAIRVKDQLLFDVFVGRQR